MDDEGETPHVLGAGATRRADGSPARKGDLSVHGAPGRAEVFDGERWTSLAELVPTPLVFIQPGREGRVDGPADPWCGSCGARVAPGLGVDLHTQWHAFATHEVIGEATARQRGLL